MKLRAIIGGAAICAATVVAAQAADIPPLVRKAPPYMQGIYNWTGSVGGHLGGAWGDIGWNDPFSGLPSSSSFGAFVGGVQTGWNYQFDSIVLGVEGDFSGMSFTANATDAAGFNHGIRSNWTSTITGRAGFAFDRALIYGKGGVAFADDNETFTDSLGNPASTSTTRTGWTAGGGIEYGLDRNLTARLEYDCLGFGTQNYTLVNPALGTGTGSANFNIQRALVGVNYRF